MAIEVHTSLTPGAFRLWRIAVRNVIDHLRRTSRWWRSMGLWLWLSADGRLRGIANLDSITVSEFVQSLGRRWPVTVRSIEVETLRAEIYRAVRRCPEPKSARYQGLKLAIWPRRVTGTVRDSWKEARGLLVEPMPILL